MLAEWFLITQLVSAPGLAGQLTRLSGPAIPALLGVLAHASDHMPAAVSLYAGLIQADPVGLAAAGADAALTARIARPLLDAALAALVTATRWPSGTLDDLDRHLPEGILPRTRAAVSAAIVAHTRETGTREDLTNALDSYGTNLRDQGRHSEALTCDREALEVYASLARSDPDLYEETYQHHLAVLRRTYDLRGDLSTSVSLHLRRNDKDGAQS